MENTFRTLVRILGLLGSFGLLFTAGITAISVVIFSAFNENLQSVTMAQEILASIVAMTLGAFFGSIVSASRPTLGGTALVLSGAAPFALALILTDGSVLSGGVILTTYNITLFTSEALLVIAGLIALVKRKTWPSPHAAIE